MAELQTNFNIAPFYDDYDEDKQYYRILFRPATAVQARELTQLQTILQKQISRFGNSIYKDGSIIEGCAFMRSSFYQVKIKDNTTSTIDFNIIVNDDNDVANSYLLVSNTTGVRAAVFKAYAGAEDVVNHGSLDTNRAYVRYVTSGNNAGIEVSQFQSNEQIDVYTPAQDKTGILNPANKLGYIYSVTSNSLINAISTGYGLRVSTGSIYQKGYFLKVLPASTIIKENSSNAAGMVVGFDTKEYIISPVEDESLYDNSIGSTNYNAPGAYRLKLVPEIVAYDKSNSEVIIPKNFLTLLEFDGGDGRVVENNTTPQYSLIMDEMAKRTAEESGDYVIKPFQTDVISHGTNANLFYYNVSAGIGYVDGYRVEFLSPRKILAPRAITTNSLSSQIVTASFGNYIQVNNVSGVFDYNNLQEMAIYSAPQSVLANNQTRSSATGTQVGTANIRAMKYDSGRKGTPSGVHNFYIFNIKMNAGYNFQKDAKSFVVTSANNSNPDAPINSFADIVTDINGKANIIDSALAISVFDTGLPSVKSLTNSNGENNTKFVYKTLLKQTLAPSNGRATATFSPNGSDKFNYGIGQLTDSETNDIDFIFGSDGISQPVITTTTIGGVSNTTCSNVVSTTDFTGVFNVGQGIQLKNTSTSAVSYHTIKSINTANSITITPNTSLTGTLSLQKFIKAGTLVDMSGAGNTFTINSLTNATLMFEFDPVSPYPSIIAAIPATKSYSQGIEKVVHKNSYVKIDCSTHTNTTRGPWTLGLPDVYKIANVHFGTDYSESNVDKKDWFYLNNGQTDSYYGLSQLVLNPKYAGSLSSSSKLLVKLDHFTANITATKAGFFSVDSYPIDDTDTADIASTIKTAEVPVYVDTSLVAHDLRNNIDFRFFMANTANVASSISNATINPPVNEKTFVKGLSGQQVVPLTEENVVYDVTFYMPRSDILMITRDGSLDIKLGLPALKPQLPTINKTGMPIAQIYVPPYPSLTFKEAE
jgi:hypothetical protein